MMMKCLIYNLLCCCYEGNAIGGDSTFAGVCDRLWGHQTLHPCTVLLLTDTTEFCFPVFCATRVTGNERPAARKPCSHFFSW